MERIDKIISEQTYYTRKEIKKLVSQGLIYVNGEQVKKSESKYDKTNISIKINGEKIEIKAKGLLAQAICHEVDHLDGKLFLKKVTKFVD